MVMLVTGEREREKEREREIGVPEQIRMSVKVMVFTPVVLSLRLVCGAFDLRWRTRSSGSKVCLISSTTFGATEATTTTPYQDKVILHHHHDTAPR